MYLLPNRGFFKDDIQVQKILTVPERTMRIVKDPRDGTLYTLTAQGDISRIRMPSPDLQLTQRIARGVRNADGVFTWTYFDLDGDIPADVPIEALRTAVANGARSSTNPVDGKLYVLNTDDASILVLPRTVIASASDFNLPYVSALFIDANGAFYVSLDVARANAPQIERVYSSADHGLNDTQGLAIGPDGSMYVGGNQGQRNANNIVIAKGLFDPATGQHTWANLRGANPFPRATWARLIISIQAWPSILPDATSLSTAARAPSTESWPKWTDCIRPQGSANYLGHSSHPHRGREYYHSHRSSGLGHLRDFSSPTGIATHLT